MQAKKSQTQSSRSVDNDRRVLGGGSQMSFLLEDKLQLRDLDDTDDY